MIRAFGALGVQPPTPAMWCRHCKRVSHSSDYRSELMNPAYGIILWILIGALAGWI